MEEQLVTLPLRKANIKFKEIEGILVKIEHPFGNLCTNIPGSLLEEMDILPGEKLHFEIFETEGLIHKGTIPFVKTFGEVNKESPLAYIDSSNRLGLAINMGNFSSEYKVKAGLSWWIRIKSINR